MRPVSTLVVAAGLLAACTVSTRAIELMTGDGYLLELAQDDAGRKSAQDYLAGTLDGLIVINEVASGEDSRMFCLSDERAAVIDTALLREEFTDWMREPPSGGMSEKDRGGLPLAVLGWAFLAAKFPCEDAKPGSAGGEVRSRLLESLPK
jgi:hypothetical protein